MAKDTMNFAQQNSERAVQATNWMRAIAEQNLNQSKAAFEGLLTIARNAVHGVDQQASAICEHSMQIAEEKELGERIMQGVDEAAKTALEGTTDVSSRRRSEAA